MPFFGPRSHNPPPLPTSDFTISSDQTNWNLIAQLGFTPTFPRDITITVNAGVVVRSTSTGTPAMDLTGLFAGSTVALVNNGTIHGRGGNAGAGNSGVGSAGGNAIEGPGASVTFTITNGSGLIAGGGGGGGGGGRATEQVEIAPGEFELMIAGGGGGGGGAGGGSGGAGAASSGTGASNGATGNAGTNGSSGTFGTGGAGGSVPSVCNGGAGASGGAYGIAGSTGASGTGGGASNSAGGAGGAAGKAIDLNGGSAPTWVSGNTAARVKGAVS